MTRHRIAQIGENRNPKSPENRPQTRRFLQIRLLQLRRSATPFSGLAVLHGRLFPVERENNEKVVTEKMTSMREWLDHRRFELRLSVTALNRLVSFSKSSSKWSQKQ